MLNCKKVILLPTLSPIMVVMLKLSLQQCLHAASEADDFDEEAARTQIEEMLNGGFGQQPNN